MITVKSYKREHTIKGFGGDRIEKYVDYEVYVNSFIVHKVGGWDYYNSFSVNSAYTTQEFVDKLEVALGLEVNWECQPRYLVSAPKYIYADNEEEALREAQQRVKVTFA